MSDNSASAFIIAALEGAIQRRSSFEEYLERNLSGNTSANSLIRSGPPIVIPIDRMMHVATRRRRVFAKRLTNAECIRTVEENDVTGEDACPICMEEKMKHPVRLIHHDKRGGDGKANLCKTAMCFSCLQDCIKSQKPQRFSDLIRPQCPCCRGDIYKAVTLTKPNVVLDLPTFRPLTYDDLFRDATRLQLTLNNDRIRHEAGGYVINEWRILTPVESVSPSNLTLVDSHDDFETLYNTVGGREFRSRCPYRNFPNEREIMEALCKKIGQLNEHSNIPRVYRLSLEVYLAEQKAKATSVVDLTDSPVKKKGPKRKKRKKNSEESAGCCGPCSKPSST